MFITAPADSPETGQVYQSSAKSQGFVMNLTRAWAWRPDVFDGFAALRGQLTGSSSLSQRELATLVCATAAQLGDGYCAIAWGRTLAREATPALAAAVLRGEPAAEATPRETALARWARQVVDNPNATTPGDVQALRETGLSDREIFEATVFIAFRHAFSSVNDALGVGPDPQLFDTAPPAVRDAVNFGRPPAQA